MDSFESLRHRLIVSCQAVEGDAFRDSGCMARFARAALDAGAAGIRANGPEDIRAIRAAVPLPILGIAKSHWEDGRILITGTFEAAREVVEAGASIVALDCTARGRRYGALERLRRIRQELRVPVMADIATVEEAVAAAEAGADLVASTMRGYTGETASVDRFEPGFIAELVRAVRVPVLAEGRVDTPEMAADALRAGAFAVIVGTAITRPAEIARRFAEAMRPLPGHVVAIDMGGTNTKSGLVSAQGRLTLESAVPTPFSAGREALLQHLEKVASGALDRARAAGVQPAAIGIATAGWVDPATGRVVYATDNLPGWTDTPIAERLRAATGLPVAVENDANALALGERWFGLGRGVDHFVCITLGTGIGGGCYIRGRLNHGAHFFANALGHIPLVPDGLPCTCGLRGCLEAYANAAALLRYAGGRFSSAEALIRAANGGDLQAREAICHQAAYMAAGTAAIVQLLDPELLILSGGLVENNPAFMEEFERDLGRRVTVGDRRALRIRLSQFGYYGGLLGAAAAAYGQPAGPG